MECRILFRFVGEEADLVALWDAFMEQFPDSELPSADSGEWYSVDEVMMDEYECRFEELPESPLMAMDGNVLVEMNFRKNSSMSLWNVLNAFMACLSGLPWKLVLTAEQAKAGVNSIRTTLITAPTKPTKFPKPYLVFKAGKIFFTFFVLK